MDINFAGSVNSLSYGLCTSYFTQELSKLGNKVNLFPIGQAEETNEYIKPALINAQSSKYSEVSLRLFHQHLLYQRIGKGKHFGFPIFELDKFNGQEKDSILSCDELIVCSDWAKQVCLDNNIDIPISVIPLGVDREIFYESELPPTDEVWYYNIGKIETRKYHDLLPQAFYDAFYDSKYKVRLFLACNGHPSHYTEQEIKNFQNSFRGKLGDKVHFLPRFSSQKDVADLMRKCHCGIFPSRAEGWNLPLLETLSCGRHAVATNCTAHTQFLSAENSFLITADRKVPAIDGKWFDGRGNWHEPDYDDLVEQLRHSYKCIRASQKLNQHGVETAKIFTWENAAKKLVEVLCN